jgi:hypothetical protein
MGPLSHRPYSTLTLPRILKIDFEPGFADGWKNLQRDGLALKRHFRGYTHPWPPGHHPLLEEEPHRRPARTDSSMRVRLGDPGSSLVFLVLAFLAGCGSSPATVGDKAGPPAAPTSAAPVDWGSLPVATLADGRFTYGRMAMSG